MIDAHVELRRRFCGTRSLILREPLVVVAVIAIASSLAVFVVYPLFMVLRTSLSQDGRITTAVFRDLLSKSYNRRPLLNSVNLGIVVAVIGTVIGFIFAYSTTRLEIPLGSFFKVVATFPMISPPLIMSLATILLLGNNGVITKQVMRGLVDFKIYGFRGLVLVETLACFSTAYLVLSGVLQAIDPAIEDAASDLAQGTRVELVVRPETVDIVPSGTGTFEATITHASYLGSQVSYEINMGGHIINAEVPNPQEKGVASRGSRVGVNLRTKSIHLLPATPS